MSKAAAIEMMVEQIRGKTVRLVETTSEHELLWAPPGTSNHILWHAGHILWIGDVLCLEPILGRSMLPGAWADSFGQHCRPVVQTRTWPGRAQIISALRAQQRAMLSELGRMTDEDLDRVMSKTSSSTLASWIVHGLHDEANHQGEIYLLQKMIRARLKTP